MKGVLILSASFFFAALLSFIPAHADDPPASPGQSTAEQPLSEPVAAGQKTTEETAAQREAYAKSLFEGRCQMCHQLPEPGMLKPEQWKLILTTMQQRMQQAKVPPLTEDETSRLLEYLDARAR
jgi:cytochrome c5